MKNIGFLLLVILVCSCSKDKKLPFRLLALNECFDFAESMGQQTGPKNFVSFEYEGREIIYSEIDGFQSRVTNRARVITSTPEINLGEANPVISSVDFLLTNRIGVANAPTPDGMSTFSIMCNSLESKSLVDLIDENLKVGRLPLTKKPFDVESQEDVEYEGFSVEIACLYCCKDDLPRPQSGNTYNPYESIHPDQNGYIECTKLIREDLGSKVRYEVDFEFEVALYLISRDYVGEITNGKMSIDFELDK